MKTTSKAIKFPFPSISLCSRHTVTLKIVLRATFISKIPFNYQSGLRDVFVSGAAYLHTVHAMYAKRRADAPGCQVERELGAH